MKTDDTIAGLPYLDYGARFYHPLSTRWTTMDPLSEKYYFLSPYAFCSNNPVNFVDWNGEDIWQINGQGYISWVKESEEHRLYTTDENGELTEDYITVKDRSSLDELSEVQGDKKVSKTSTDGNVDDIFNIFKFAADNTSVEWVIHKNGDAYTLGTIHDSDRAGGWEDYGLEQPDASVHSHPGVQTSANNEIESMGYWSEGVAKGSDWDNVVNDVNANKKYTRLSYVYFPNSTNLYFVGYHKAQYIRKVNNYKRFYFGTLNNR